MKRSGYRTIFHIYLIFFLSLLGAVLLAGCLIFMTISIRTPDGTIARSDWPKTFTEDFKDQIIFIEAAPQIKQAGIALLRDNGVGIQILDPSGCEVFGYQEPEQANTTYSSAELLQLFQAGKLENSETTAFVGIASNAGTDYIYILYFPVDVSKVTMYVNGERFAGGKTIILPILSAMLLLVLISGVLYGVLKKEDQLYDRKSARKDPKGLSNHIVAFANADGGTLVIGIEDNGDITGIDDYTKNVNEILRVPFDFCKPSVLVETETVDCIDVNGKANHLLLIRFRKVLSFMQINRMMCIIAWAISLKNSVLMTVCV